TDRPELKPLAKFADRKLSSISYTSKALAAKTAVTKEDVEGFVGLFEMELEKLPLTKEERQKVQKDLKELAKEVKEPLPEPGASLDFAFATDRGTESYAYDWTRYPGAAEPKLLTILEHVGGDPIAVYAGRNPSRDASYKMFVKYVKLADGYIDDLLLPKLEEFQRKQVQVVLDLVQP